MPYQPEWYNPEKSIIRVEVNGVVTWDEWYEMIDKLFEMLGSVSQEVSIIYDDKVGMPKGNPMPHLKASTEKLTSHSNLGIIVTVGARRVSGVVETMVDVMMRAYRMDTTHYGGFVDSMDEALKLIEASSKKTQANKNRA